MLSDLGRDQFSYINQMIALSSDHTALPPTFYNSKLLLKIYFQFSKERMTEPKMCERNSMPPS